MSGYRSEDHEEWESTDQDEVLFSHEPNKHIYVEGVWGYGERRKALVASGHRGSIYSLDIECAYVSQLHEYDILSHKWSKCPSPPVDRLIGAKVCYIPAEAVRFPSQVMFVERPWAKPVKASKLSDLFINPSVRKGVHNIVYCNRQKAFRWNSFWPQQ